MTDFLNSLPLGPLVSLPLLALLILFTWGRVMTLLMFFQQEEYDGPRYLRWIKSEGAFDRSLSLWALAAAITGAMGQTDTLGILSLLAPVLMWGGLIHGALRSHALRRDSKKPLVLTPRAKRIRDVTLLFALGLLLALAFATLLAPAGRNVGFEIGVNNVDFVMFDYDWAISATAAALILYTQLLPLMMVLANAALSPVEERVKAGFRNEAKARLAKVNPKVIAITGSFGKTSTKHILGHILSSAAPTCMTPGSVNTDMGITRVIREQLKDEDRFFIVEMGAYGPGSIGRLCGLTPPDVSMVTAVGPAHYERFKTLETVAQAKFEIAEAVFARGGKAIVSTDGIPPHLLKERMSVVRGDYIQVGTTGDVAIKNVTQTAEGTRFTLDDPDEGPQELMLPLFGTHQPANAALAAIAARAAGVPWSIIRAALRTMPQIRHRLEIVREPGAPTIIDDAYNSNPVGFAAALDVLDLLVADGGRRIVITPGMVELGAEHDQAHKELGTVAASHSDIIAAVTPERMPTFVSAVEDAIQEGAPVRLLKFARQADAEAWVRGEWKAGDAVLFENNLPDLYEAVVRF